MSSSRWASASSGIPVRYFHLSGFLSQLPGLESSCDASLDLLWSSLSLSWYVSVQPPKSASQSPKKTITDHKVNHSWEKEEAKLEASDEES